MTTEITAYFKEKIPSTWLAAEPTVEVDDDEILWVGPLPTGTVAGEFRERTREARMAIAAEAESRFERKVSWGIEVDGRRTLFTTLGLPVMTRLRLPERAVLDTLVTAGVARSRSEALAWCVKLVGRHQSEWLDDLRAALVDVERVRTEGPTLS
jgi:hypothetical protein